MSDDYDTRRANAQGRELACVPGQFMLICMDVSVSDEGFKVTDVPLREIKQDEYGVGMEFQIFQGKSWRNARVSWLRMGAEEGYCAIDDHGPRGLQARIYCHSAYRDQNIEEIRDRFAEVLAEKVRKIEKMAAFVSDTAPSPSRLKP